MLNIGPDGNGAMPPYSVKYLRATGAWLKKNGAGIYGTTAGFIPAQPWGVTTAKPGKLFLHVLQRPANGKIILPGCTIRVKQVYTLDGKQPLTYKQEGKNMIIHFRMPAATSPNTVLVVEYSGQQPAYAAHAPVTVSRWFPSNYVEAVHAKTSGGATTKSLTYSHYFGDWKHTTCVTDMKNPEDKASFQTWITDPGDYKISLEYACPPESAKQEGVLRMNDKEYLFRSLRTSAFEKSAPLLFIRHTVSIVNIAKPGIYTMELYPGQQGAELFKLKGIVVEPVE